MHPHDAIMIRQEQEQDPEALQKKIMELKGMKEQAKQQLQDGEQGDVGTKDDAPCTPSAGKKRKLESRVIAADTPSPSMCLFS
jgi:hypothetical protein